MLVRNRYFIKCEKVIFVFQKFGAKKLTFGAKSRAKPHGLRDLGTARIKVIYKKN